MVNYLPVLSLLLILQLFCTALAPAAVGPRSGERDLVRTLDKWRRAYQAGKISLETPVVQEAKKHAIYQKGMLPTKLSRRFTHEKALEFLMEKVVEAPSVDGTREALRLAALGLGEKVKLRAPPYRVRDIVLRALRHIEDKGVLVFLAGTARGDRQLWPGTLKTSYRAAAVLALANPEHRTFRPLIEARLQSSDRLLRLAAADALRQAGWAESLGAAGAALQF